MKIRFFKFLSLGFICGGLFLTLNAAFPIVKYEVASYQKGLFRREFLSPIADPAPYPLNLVQAKNWFVDAPDLPPVASKVKYYNVSIPRLKIAGATVEIAGEDLSKTLVHFRGTALPGRSGNAVIFGHSTLPQLFNPKNYLTIFSFLPTLEKNDVVYVDYDGISYTYQVEQIFEVKPDAVQILEQSRDDSYLTLVTCVPPGTYLRRLIVKARIVPPGDV